MVARLEGRMTGFDELSWDEAMRRGHAAITESESLYEDINASEGARTSISRSTCGGRR
jgi:hypothetical protein